MFERQVIKFLINLKKFVYLQLHVVCNLRSTHHMSCLIKWILFNFVVVVVVAQYFAKFMQFLQKKNRGKVGIQVTRRVQLNRKYMSKFIAGILSNEKGPYTSAEVSFCLTPSRRRKESLSRSVARLTFPVCHFFSMSNICHT